MPQSETKKSNPGKEMLSGLITGMFCSGLFNPWDRALYLSVKHNRSFLSIENFKSPYQGFTQALIQRAFLGGIYYSMQGELNSTLYPVLQENMGAHPARFFIGIACGSISGMCTNSISAVKYHTWGKENYYFWSSVQEMWQLGGVRSFTKGTVTTMQRDMVFGGSYEVMRHFLYSSNNANHYLQWGSNTFAAVIAVLLSGPFNYARNMQYATPPHQSPPSLKQCLSQLWQESKQSCPTPLSRVSFFQSRLRIGWGTARVGVGMAVGQTVFDWTREKFY